MDIRAYIESGVLELYAIGALPEAEAHEVAEAVAQHPELRAELEEISRTLQAIAPIEGKEPSLSLREKILNSLPADTPNVSTENRTSGGARIVPFDGDSSAHSYSGRRYLLAASFIGLLLSASAAIWFWSEWKSAQKQLADATELVNRTATSYQEVQNELRTLRNYQNRMVRMTSTGKTPGALAVVYWNPDTKEVFIDPASMPPLPEGKQYQLWAIADGDPVDAGVFDPASPSGNTGLQQLKNVIEVKVFAVTVEPRGGSLTPTLETMTVSGQL